jgi:hypothetical protein
LNFSQGIPGIRFAADFADSFFVHDSDAGTIAAENPAGEIGVGLSFRRGGRNDLCSQFQAAMMAKNAFVQYDGSAGWAISPA